MDEDEEKRGITYKIMKNKVSIILKECSNRVEEFEKDSVHQPDTYSRIRHDNSLLLSTYAN